MVRLKNEQIILLVLIVLVLVVGSGLLIWQKLNNQTIIAELSKPVEINMDDEIKQEEEINHTQQREEKEKKIIVHVAGEVNNPGVYELPGEARVFDAIKAAGGETVLADLDSLNLAAFIYDGERVYIPSRDETFPGSEKDIQGGFGEGSGRVSFSNSSGKININQATAEELQKISGIGPSKAKSIIDYRNKIGRFTDLEQLLEVSGIGEKTLEKIKDEITLR